MDNQLRSDAITMLEFTETQELMLRQLLMVEQNKKLSIRFSDPTRDAQHCRSVAYLDGGIEMLETLLSFDIRARDSAEEEKQALAHPGQAAESQSFPGF